MLRRSRRLVSTGAVRLADYRSDANHLRRRIADTGRRAPAEELHLTSLDSTRRPLHQPRCITTTSLIHHLYTISSIHPSIIRRVPERSSSLFLAALSLFSESGDHRILTPRKRREEDRGAAVQRIIQHFRSASTSSILAILPHRVTSSPSPLLFPSFSAPPILAYDLP